MCEVISIYSVLLHRNLYLFPKPQSIDNHSNTVSFKSGKYEFSNLVVFFFSRSFRLPGILYYHVNFRLKLSISTQKGKWNFDMDSVKDVKQFEELNIKSSIPWMQGIFPF